MAGVKPGAISSAADEQVLQAQHMQCIVSASSAAIKADMGSYCGLTPIYAIFSCTADPSGLSSCRRGHTIQRCHGVLIHMQDLAQRNLKAADRILAATPSPYTAKILNPSTKIFYTTCALHNRTLI